ncbi:His Kinase A (phospho-acceptor) domain-containing protein [Ekhidna lutea]|uniref:histidine kinase n=1 Tax=Ekhidna lutea TaxID=447679 RepID=A0A239EWQ6_EKHLU|nr:HAMP domain-containing sensor histidine kinase [Ekhidna lutea]SNS49017.1 His Kinase A (phospho-acceptor) domain-containing protein [Ekhidna lutea]
MLPQPVLIVIVQYVIQALMAMVIMLILRKFYRQYQNEFYRFWSISWLALFVTMIGSCIALANAFLLPLDHPFRLLVSVITLYAGFLQIAWLYAGTREISRTTKVDKSKMRAFLLVAVPICATLVIIQYDDPNAGDYRIFYRVGIKSLLAGGVFVTCALMLKKISKAGIGIRFIIFSFILYGLMQLNYFVVTLCEINNIPYGAELPFFMGAFELFLQSLMGLGMIISVLEIEQHNLKKANIELDTFLYRSSHDLRAPLTTISGIISMIKGTDDQKKIDEYHEAIQSRIDQVDNVIRDIITLRKGQKSDLRLIEINLEDEIKKEFEHLIDPNVKYPALHVKSNRKPIIRTDPARLHTVLTNILSNAIKYHDLEGDNPKISVQISCVDDGIDFSITDNGQGIDQRHLPKIFDMFFRASQTSQGTGLGLYLVRDAIDNLKGTIGVKSEKGKGTTFDIHLPNL